MYVAKIEGSGMDALAVLGIVLPITLIIQAFANLISLGGTAFVMLAQGLNPFILTQGYSLLAMGTVFDRFRDKHRTGSPVYFYLSDGGSRFRVCNGSLAVMRLHLYSRVLCYPEDSVSLLQDR